MSSKIKVDTIENVAGSGNVSLGSGHNLVVLELILQLVVHLKVVVIQQ